jgi:hypothetical protein
MGVCHSCGDGDEVVVMELSLWPLVLGQIAAIVLLLRYARGERE